MPTADEYAAWIVKNADKKGTPEFDVVSRAYQDARAKPAAAPVAPPEKPFGVQMNEEIADLPRKAGRFARAGLQGVGGTLDFAATPFRAAMNLVPGANFQPGFANELADYIGLPKPRPGIETVADQGAETIASGVGFIKAAQGINAVGNKALGYFAQRAASGANLGRLGQAGQKVASIAAPLGATMAANPGMQLVSAGAAGTAGGYVRETGGGPGAQFVAALGAGLAAPMAMNKLQQVGGMAASAFRPSPITPQQIDIQINTALQPSGMVLGDLPDAIRAGIRKDVADALRINGDLNPDAVRRLADYRLVGATPSAGGLTLDPATVTQQKNLAKLGINSKDVAAQELGRMANQNNSLLISRVNELGAGTAGTQVNGGRKIMGALDDRNALAKSMIKQRYDAARATDGRSAAIDPSAFTNRANDLLDEALLGGKLPSDVRNLLNRASTGAMPLTVDVAEQFKTRIGDLQRATTDMAERNALGMVRQALDEAPLLPGQQMGQQSIDAFNRARKINRTWMGIVDKTPALQAVRDGIEPDKFVQQFITGNANKANIADVQALRSSIKSNPEAMQTVKEQIVGHLKTKALNGAADEVGALSQSGYNKALREIGDEKLALFFTKSEIDQMKAVGRVASYEQFQPVGSAVNNSNTAGTLMANILDRIAGSAVMSKIPLGNALQQPAQNIVVGMKSRQSLNVPNALMTPKIQAPNRNRLMLSPAALAVGEDR